jgi:hypothetical protein
LLLAAGFSLQAGNQELLTKALADVNDEQKMLMGFGNKLNQ